MHTARLTTYALLLAGATGLGLSACGNSSQNETGTPLVNDEERYPGNDGGQLPTENRLDDSEANTIGTVNSYEGEAVDGEGIYDATVGAESDNPNKSSSARGEVNDPVTPNGPLADGTIGQPDAATGRSERSARAAAGGGTDGNGLGERRADDGPYGTSKAPSEEPGMANRVDTSARLGEKAYVSAQAATDLPVFVPGGDLDAYVSRTYGDGGARNSPTEQPGGDAYAISTFRPAISDVAAASYANTQTKLVPKPSSQNYLVYQPIQLKVVPLRSWNASAADSEAEATDAYLGEDCAGADDAVACSSGAFDRAVAPMLNDARVARGIAEGNIDGFHFEIDAQGRVVPNSLSVRSGAADCNSAGCARLRNLLAGALSPMTWTPGTRDGQAVGARVIVPLRRDVRLAGSKPNTP